MDAIVEVLTGKLRGRLVNGGYVFTGVPYGSDTAGENRFRPPPPPRSWTGIRAATEFGPAAPQPDVGMPGTLWGDWLALNYPERGTPLGGRPVGEDCLVLNVWSPSINDDAQRPVLVWLHGGGFLIGAGHEEPVRGDNLARRHDVVVVTINHRLGVFGFLDVEELLGPEFADSGAAGILDIVAALEWVRDNIAQFGGDPSNVTVFGQSGGGAKVCALLAAPAAKGLFHRAIVQSSPMHQFIEREDAARAAHALLAELGLSRARARELQHIDVHTMVSAQRRINPRHVNPVVGPSALPAHPIDSMGAPWSAHIPLMIGTTLDDAAIRLLHDPHFGTMTPANLRDSLSAQFGSGTDDVLLRYRTYWPDLSYDRLFARILSEHAFRAVATQLATRRCQDGNGVTYLYLFTYETDELGGLLGSCHGLELPFVFVNVDRIPHAGRAPDRYRVEDNASTLWSSFARDGSPALSDAPPWLPFDLTDHATLLIDSEVKLENNPWGEGLRAIIRSSTSLERPSVGAVQGTPSRR